MAEKTKIRGRRVTSSSRRSIRRPTSRFAFPAMKKREMADKINKYKQEVGPLPRRKTVPSANEWVARYQEYAALVAAYDARYGN